MSPIGCSSHLRFAFGIILYNIWHVLDIERITVENRLAYQHTVCVGGQPEFYVSHNWRKQQWEK